VDLFEAHLQLTEISNNNSKTKKQIIENNKNPKITDVDQPRNTSKDPLHVPNGLMTRSKTKALKEALNALVLNVSTKSKLKSFIHVQKVSNTALFEP
jgi:hypothetical protein